MEQVVASIGFCSTGVGPATFVVRLRAGDLVKTYYGRLAMEGESDAAYAGLVAIEALHRPCQLVLGSDSRDFWVVALHPDVWQVLSEHATKAGHSLLWHSGSNADTKVAHEDALYLLGGDPPWRGIEWKT